MAGQNPQQDPKEVARQDRYKTATDTDIGAIKGPNDEVKNPLVDIGVKPTTLRGIASNINNIKWGSAQLYSGIAGKHKKSIIGMARANVFEFPVFISDSVPMKFATATNTLLEQVYAAWLQMAISVNPVIPYEQYKAAAGSPFAAYKTDTSKYLECVDLSFQKDSCHKEIVNEEEGITLEFNMISIPDNVARVINETVDYQPLSEFEHYFTEANKPNGPNNPNPNPNPNQGGGGKGGKPAPRNIPFELPVLGRNGEFQTDFNGSVKTKQYNTDEVRDLNAALQALKKMQELQDSRSTIPVFDGQDEWTATKIKNAISAIEYRMKNHEEDVAGGNPNATGSDSEFKKKTSAELERMKLEDDAADTHAKRTAKSASRQIDDNTTLDGYDIDEENRAEQLKQNKKRTKQMDDENEEIDVRKWDKDGKETSEKLSGTNIRKHLNAAQLEKARREEREHEGQKRQICDTIFRNDELCELFGINVDKTNGDINYDANGRATGLKYDKIYDKVMSKIMLDETLIQDVRSKQLQRELKAAIDFEKAYGMSPELARELREESREKREERRDEREERKLNYELNATKAPQFIDENKIKKMNSLKPLMMVVNMHIMAKDGHVSHPMEYVVGVRTHCRLVKSSILPEVVEYPTKEMNKIARKAKWRAGELKFFRDIVFHIKEKKQTAIDSRDPNRKWYRRLYELAHMKGDGNVSKKISGSGYTHGLIPNATIVISKADVDNIEEATGVDVLKPSVARGLCESLFLMNFVVIDIDAESIKILSPDMNNDFDVQSLDSVNKQIAELSTAGKSVMDVFNMLK